LLPVTVTLVPGGPDVGETLSTGLAGTGVGGGDVGPGDAASSSGSRTNNSSGSQAAVRRLIPEARVPAWLDEQSGSRF